MLTSDDSSYSYRCGFFIPSKERAKTEEGILSYYHEIKLIHSYYSTTGNIDLEVSVVKVVLIRKTVLLSKISNTKC